MGGGELNNFQNIENNFGNIGAMKKSLSHMAKKFVALIYAQKIVAGQAEDCTCSFYGGLYSNAFENLIIRRKHVLNFRNRICFPVV